LRGLKGLRLQHSPTTPNVAGGECMHMHACMHACMHAEACACMQRHAVCMHKHACMHAEACRCTHADACMQMHACGDMQRVGVKLGACMRVVLGLDFVSCSV